jgi:hypothetical protein
LFLVAGSSSYQAESNAVTLSLFFTSNLPAQKKRGWKSGESQYAGIVVVRQTIAGWLPAFVYLRRSGKQLF